MKKIVLLLLLFPLWSFPAQSESTAKYAMDLLKNDCEVSATGGSSIVSWPHRYDCGDDEKIVKLASEKKQIPFVILISSVLKKYGDIGFLKKSGDPAKYIKKDTLISIISSEASMNQLYNDYIDGVNEYGFKTLSKSAFYSCFDEIRKKSISQNSDGVIVKFDFGENLSADEKKVIAALNTVKFTSSAGYVFAEGRKLTPEYSSGSFVDAIKMNINDCYEIGEYANQKAIPSMCVNALVDSIKEWGVMSRDRTISDNAWSRAYRDASVTYNPIKYQISFSHWVGMARLYRSKGY